MNVIVVDHKTQVELRLAGAIWWEQKESIPSGQIGGIVEVQHYPSENECQTINCKITQIIRTTNSNRYVYRLVKVND